MLAELPLLLLLLLLLGLLEPPQAATATAAANAAAVTVGVRSVAVLYACRGYIEGTASTELRITL